MVEMNSPRRAPPAAVHVAVDRLVRWRLGAIAYAAGIDDRGEQRSADEFWAASRVDDPAPIHIAGDWRHARSRELRLEGPSVGAGGHPGARRLIGTAHLTAGARAGAPVILVVHGYAVPMPVWDAMQARRLRRAGAHTMRVDLPFHLRRRVPGRVSGDGFFAADPAHVLASVRQSVEDAAALVAWARREVSPVVGVLGVSLGGLVTLLLAARVRLEAAVAVAPFCDPPATFLGYLPRNAQRRVGLSREGGGAWGPDRLSARRFLDDALGPIVPRRLTPRTCPQRMTVVRPLHDIIVGPEPVAELADAWGVEMWDYPFGHITVMNAPGIGARIRQRVLDAAHGATG